MLKKLSKEGAFEANISGATAGKVCAFVPVVSGDRIGLGIAVANEAGYMPVPLTWCHGDNFNEMSEHADELNMEYFQFNADAGGRIVASTMRPIATNGMED